MTRHIGGSLLPSNDRQVLTPKAGKFGTFETRPLPDLDTHGLFFARVAGEFAGLPMLIAMHPNGYSCDELAKRILAAWEGGDQARALAQFDYILQCGGLGSSRDAITRLIETGWQPVADAA